MRARVMYSRLEEWFHPIRKEPRTQSRGSMRREYFMFSLDFTKLLILPSLIAALARTSSEIYLGSQSRQSKLSSEKLAIVR